MHITYINMKIMASLLYENECKTQIQIKLWKCGGSQHVKILKNWKNRLICGQNWA